MDVRGQRILLWMIGAILLIAAVATALYSVQAAYEIAAARSGAISTTQRVNATDRSEPTLADLQSVAQVNWRRPLFDAPSPAPVIAPPPPPPPPLTVRLAGTIIEPGHSRAVLVGPDGKTELKGVGEHSGPAEVLEIGQDTCTVRYLGNRVTLKIDKGVGG
jgi:hypothetical protein